MRRKLTFALLAAYCSVAPLLSVAAGMETNTEIVLSGMTGPDFSIAYNTGQPDAFVLTANGITVDTQLFLNIHSGCGVTLPIPEQKPVWQLSGTQGNSGYEDNSAWIDITVTGDAALSSIEITGMPVGSGTGGCIAGFSTETDGTGYQDGEFTGFVSGRCGSHVFVSPPGKEIKSIRIVRSRNFAGEQVNDASVNLSLKDIMVYCTYLPTHIEHTLWNGSDGVYSGKTLFMNEACTMKIYNLSGSLLQTIPNATSFSFELFPPGMYIVKTVNNQGKEKVMKVMR